MSNLIGMSVEDIVVDDGDFVDEPLIGVGLHPAVIVSIVEGVSQGGDDYCRLVFEITGGPDSGKKVTDFWSWSNEMRDTISKKKFRSLLSICGVKGRLQSLDQLTSRPLQINNKHYRGNEGAIRNSINYYRGPVVSNDVPVSMHQSVPAPTWGQSQSEPAPMPAQPQPVAQQVAQQPPVPQQPPMPQQVVQPPMPQPVAHPVAQPQPVQVATPMMQPQQVAQPVQPVAHQPVQQVVNHVQSVDDNEPPW